jgi:hypothetical protein
MNRHHLHHGRGTIGSLNLLPLLACLLTFTAAPADDQPTQPAAAEGAKPLPAGLRVLNAGNSWQTEDSGPLCTAAGITGHHKVRGEKLHVWDNLLPYLERGDIDVYVYGAHPTPIESWRPNTLPLLVATGPKHNPNFRVQFQMPWLVGDGRQGVTSAEQFNDTDLDAMQAAMDGLRKAQEAWADEVNAKAGKRVLVLVPLGDAMLTVRKMIKAGKFPGVVNQSGSIAPGQTASSVLSGDIMPHQGALAGQLGRYMHFAAMYRMSPEGLDVKTDFTPEQTAALKKLAWDTISTYPYAGVAPSPGAPARSEPTPQRP